jgi:hypothetical protein
MPLFKARTVPYPLQQAIGVGAQAGVTPRGSLDETSQMCRLTWLVIAAADGGHFDDPAGADLGLGDVLWCLVGAQRLGECTALADLVIACHKRDLAFSMDLAADLAAEGLLVCLNRQEEVGSLLLELTKKGFWVCSASAWISTPSRFSALRS